MRASVAAVNRRQNKATGLRNTIESCDGEFFLGVEGPGIPLRRIQNWTGWDDYTFDYINLMYSGRWNNPTSGDFSTNYYRAFDIEVGEQSPRVTSPWSHDVDEIYMRSRDPVEEFGDVSPRALWLDTS